MPSPELWIALLALVIALYSAAQSRRSATSAEHSAGAAESTTELEHRRERDLWIERLADTIPDTKMTPRIIDSLPPHLAAEWKELVLEAAKRSDRVQYDAFVRNLEDQHFEKWQPRGLRSSARSPEETGDG
jgi:hypothetical protein